MNAIITVVGTDQVGIIAKVSNFLAQHSINIADISQTILSGNFVMMMMVDLSAAQLPMEELRTALNELGQQLSVSINIISKCNFYFLPYFHVCKGTIWIVRTIIQIIIKYSQRYIITWHCFCDW